MKPIFKIHLLSLVLTGCGNYVDYSTLERAEKECEQHNGIQKLYVFDSTSVFAILARAYCRDGAMIHIKEGSVEDVNLTGREQK